MGIKLNESVKAILAVLEKLTINCVFIKLFKLKPIFKITLIIVL